MPKNILLIDLNVILDVLLERCGLEASRSTLKLNELSSYELHVSTHTVTTFAYLLENAKIPQPQVIRHVDWLLHTFAIVSVDTELLNAALKSRIKDYEDAVIECAAISCKASKIITRNVKDFKESAVQALTPEEYISTIS